MGVPAFGHLGDPRELAIGSAFTIVAGGSSGTVQAIRTQPDWLEVVAGRYPGPGVSNIARYRDFSFGTVGGVAYDETAGLIYLTETLGNRIDVVTIGDPMNADTWTFAQLAAPVMLDGPTGLYLDGQTLYVADTGNHAIRAIDLTTGLVTTPFGTAATRGFFGDGGPANAALLFEPRALTRCTNGDFFIADTGNNRIRRVDSTGTITTILGDGFAASSGEGGPATTFPVNAPQGLDCDALGNLYASSTTVVREITADGNGIVDGTGPRAHDLRRGATRHVPGERDHLPDRGRRDRRCDRAGRRLLHRVARAAREKLASARRRLQRTRRCTPVSRDFGNRVALEEAGREDFVELEVVEVDVADVAVAVDLGAGARREIGGPVGGVEFADRIGDVVSATHGAVTVDGDRA